MEPRKVQFTGHDGILPSVFTFQQDADMQKICAFAIAHSDRESGTPEVVNNLLNGQVQDRRRVNFAGETGQKVPINYAISSYQSYLESKGFDVENPEADVYFNIHRNKRRFDKILVKYKHLQTMLMLNTVDQLAILDGVSPNIIVKYAGVFHYTGMILPQTCIGAQIFGALLSLATISLPKEDAYGPVMITRPTRSSLVNSIIRIAEAKLATLAFADVPSANAAVSGKMNLAIDLAMIANSQVAWKEIYGRHAVFAVRKLLKMAKNVAQVLVNLEDRGEFTLCYWTSLSCHSSGNVNLYNHLIWILCDLRKKLRNAVNCLDKNSSVYKDCWPLIMSFPPATRMLDLDNYTPIELLVLSLLKEYGPNATLPKVILGAPLATGVPLQLNQLAKSIDYMMARNPDYPKDELLPMGEVAKFSGAAYNYAAAERRLARTAAQQVSGIRARDIFSIDNPTVRDLYSDDKV